MSLNPAYVTAPNFQQFFVDKNGLPLVNGQIYFYSDVNRTDPKNVYTIAGSEANYNYIPLPNPLTLSLAGTVVDDQGNPVVIYWLPVNANFPNEQELYYVVLKDQYGAIQQIVQAWPNPISSGSSSSDDIINYIPNGQFLSHTNLPNNLLVGGSNVVAQGGFSMEMNDPLFSTNTFEFQQLVGSPSGISNSPRYQAVFNSSANINDTMKVFRTKWPDVNKFASETVNQYTFGFWAMADVNTPISINYTKFFGTGGSPTVQGPPIPLEIGTNLNFYQVFVDFGDNNGTFVGPNNDDFISVDINFPLNITFTIDMTDFVMIQGAGPIQDFPLQTNASMLSTGVAGWMTTPNPDGSDLYCPLVLTREGMEFDHSEIGTILASPAPVLSPSNPLATTNLMPCDGTTYVSSQYSALGIPYFRLSNYLMSASGNNYPLYGTGPNFATAWEDYADDTSFYVTVNSPGTPIALAADGMAPNETGWNFATNPIYTNSAVITYGATQVGRTAIYPTASWNTSALFQAFSATAATTSVTDGVPATAFGLTLFSGFTGLFAYQTTTGFYGTATTAAALAVGAGQCKYFNVVYGGVTYKIQYRIAGVGTVTTGANDITIDLAVTATAATVAQMTAYALQALQVSKVTVTSDPGTGLTAGDYWTFQTNPAATINYYCWYTIGGIGTNPAPLGTGIQVNLVTADTIASVVTKTITGINSYQFAAPDLEGVFLRGYDSTPTWDLDKTTRFSQGQGPGGVYGSYEYPQYESHTHPLSNGAGGVFGTIGASASTTGVSIVPFVASDILNSGGSETRPVNTYVNWVIKY